MADAGIVIVGAGEAGARAAHHAARGGLCRRADADRRRARMRPTSARRCRRRRSSARARRRFPTIGDAAALADLRIDHLTSVAVASIDQIGAARRAFRSAARLPTTSCCWRPAPSRAGCRCPAATPRSTLRNFDDAIALRGHMQAGRRIAIIGGGFIGLELASSACALGCEVVVDRGGAAHSDARRAVRDRRYRRGAPPRGGRSLSASARRSPHISPARRWPCRHAGATGALSQADCVIAGIGAAPEIALAAAAGLTIDNGIAVDGQLRTSDPHIYAAGDCASFPHPLYDGRRIRLEAWRNAFDQGAFVARSMLGAARRVSGGSVVLVGSARSQSANRRAGR